MGSNSASEHAKDMVLGSKSMFWVMGNPLGQFSGTSCRCQMSRLRCILWNKKHNRFSSSGQNTLFLTFIYCIHLWGPEPHQGRISNLESEHLGIGNHLGAFSWAWQFSQMVSHNQKPEGWNQNYVSSMNRTKVTISLHEVILGISFLFLTFRSWVLTPEP